MMDCKNAMRNIMFVWHFMFHVRYILLDIKLEKVYDLLNMALWYDTARPEEHVRRQYKLYGGHIMTQIKNIPAVKSSDEFAKEKTLPVKKTRRVTIINVISCEFSVLD